jgi:hypothetical protein
MYHHQYNEQNQTHSPVTKLQPVGKRKQDAYQRGFCSILRLKEDMWLMFFDRSTSVIIIIIIIIMLFKKKLRRF